MSKSATQKRLSFFILSLPVDFTEVKNPLEKSHFQSIDMFSRCLKITDKVSFNIASEASYVYILSGQKLIKNAKNGPFWRVFENLKLAIKQCYQASQF